MLSVPFSRKPRLRHFLAVAACAALWLLAAAPAAAVGIPPEGSWEWAGPSLSTETISRFQLLAAGPAGSVYAAGDSWQWQWVVSRVDTANGVETWVRTSTGPGALGAKPLAVASDGKRNLVVAGQAAASNGDIYVVKYDPEGDVLWEKSWNGPKGLEDRANAVAVDKAGNVYVAGHSDMGGGYTDAVLLKYDPAGRLKWKLVLATPLYDSFAEVACDGSGNAYLTGTRAGEMGSSQMVTLKVTRDGKRSWMRTIAGLGISYGGEHLRVKGTSVYVTGTLNKNGSWPIFAKYGLTGRRYWETTSSHTLDSITDMAVDAQGRLYIVGNDLSSLTTPPASSGYLWVLDPAGGLSASAGLYADYGPSARHPVTANKMALASDGTVYLAGSWHTNTGGTEGNALVARIPSIDAPGWSGVDRIWRYDGPASGVDEFYGILRVSDTEIVAAGVRITGGSVPQGFVHRPELP